MVKTIGEIEAAGFINKFTELYGVKLNVTPISGTVDISALTECNTIMIENVGETDCYLSLTSVATTDDMFLESEGLIILKNVNFSSISAITPASTTELNIIAYSGNKGQKNNSEVLKLDVTTVSSTDVFSNITEYKDILIINEGDTDCYIKLDNTATINDLLLKSKSVISIENCDIHELAAITSTGTTTVKALGIW